jgi:hypothetical protein
MTHAMSKCASLVFILSLFVVGCDERSSQTPKVDTSQGDGAVPIRLHDPMERNKGIATLKQPGHWQVKGDDDSGAHWEGYLIVEHDPTAFMTSGYFEWSRQGDGGRYHFQGTYDPETRVVRWTGITVQIPFGHPCNAEYQATLSQDGRTLVNGSWQGGISIPGRWNGERIDAR